jgi:xanthine dehydrogenase accessory factor
VTLLERLAALGEERAVLFTELDGEHAGAKLLVLETGETVGDGTGQLAAHAGDLLRGGRSRELEVDGRRVFAEVYGPPPRLLVYGAVDTAEALCAAAKLLGWTTIVADARAKFATGERLPSADRVLVAWPEQAFAQAAPDHATAVVVLTHDDKFDVPALQAALASEAFYVGAIGARRTQDRRRERLREAGLDEAALARIAGPAGLDIGSDTIQETAVSILSEILATRAGRGGGPLREAKQRIHAGAS